MPKHNPLINEKVLSSEAAKKVLTRVMGGTLERPQGWKAAKADAAAQRTRSKKKMTMRQRLKLQLPLELQILSRVS